MNFNDSWGDSFVSYVKTKLQTPPSSRDLVDLLTEYSREKTNNTDHEDWAEEYLEAAKETLDQKNIFDLINDRDDKSDEAVSIKLRNNLPPNKDFLSPPRSQENLQPPSSDLLNYRQEKLEQSFDSMNKILNQLSMDMGSRSGFSINLFEWLRNNEPKLKKIEEMDDKFKKLSETLDLHIGKDEFKCEADTFKTHYDHILFAFPTGKWKENGWFWLIFSIVIIGFGGTIYQASSYMINFNNKINDIEKKLEQFERKINGLSNPTFGGQASPLSSPKITGTTSSPNPGASNTKP
jgi:hypothetical protein